MKLRVVIYWPTSQRRSLATYQSTLLQSATVQHERDFTSQNGWIDVCFRLQHFSNVLHFENACFPSCVAVLHFERGARGGRSNEANDSMSAQMGYYGDTGLLI